MLAVCCRIITSPNKHFSQAWVERAPAQALNKLDLFSDMACGIGFAILFRILFLSAVMRMCALWLLIARGWLIAPLREHLVKMAR